MWYAVPSASDMGEEPVKSLLPRSPEAEPLAAGGRSQWEDMSEDELDALAARWYHESITRFAVNTGNPKPRRKRRMHEYTRRNCEEARVG